MSKPIVRQWMREEFAEGKLDNIPAEVIEILKAEVQPKGKHIEAPSLVLPSPSGIVYADASSKADEDA